MTEIETRDEAVARLAEYLSPDVARTLRALAAAIREGETP